MEVNEVRIGNWCYAFKTTWSIDVTDFQGERISTYKPIPLTEEWLLKFGFCGHSLTLFEKYNEDDPNKTYRHLLGFYWEVDGVFELEIILDKKDKDDPEFYSVVDVTTFKLNIKYVHQLQNLYFALTGQELTIQTMPTLE